MLHVHGLSRYIIAPLPAKGPNMNQFAVVTDSTSNLPPELVEKLDIRVIPLTVHWGGD